MAGGEFKQLLHYSDFEKIRTLYSDTEMLVVSKPAGLETISQDGLPDLTGLLRERLGLPTLTPAHRLDRDTSGAQLFARTSSAERDLTALFRKRDVGKTYIALCLGVPRNRNGRIRRNLSEWSGGRRPVRVLKTGGLEAETEYRILTVSRELPDIPKTSLIAFSPRQGRTHQIRVHAAAFGYPILGDDQYGDRPSNRSAKTFLGIRRQALHSWRLEFMWRGQRVAVSCPLPEDLLKAAETAFDDLRRLPQDLFHVSDDAG